MSKQKENEQLILEPELSGKNLISYSRFNSFMNCPYKYHLRYQRRVRPIKNPIKFVFGKTIHECLAYYYGNHQQHKLEDILEYFDILWEEVIKDENIDYGMEKVTKAMVKENPDLEYGSKIPIHPQHYYDMGIEILTQYFAVYAGEKLDVVFVEESFTTSFKNPRSNYKNRKWALTGVIDLLIKNKKGNYEIWDHKCMGKALDRATMELSHQVSSYYVGAASLGIPPEKIEKAVFNILYKTSGYPMERIETSRTVEQQKEFLKQLNSVSKAMDNSKIFQNINFSCAACEYYPWCKGEREEYFSEGVEELNPKEEIYDD